MKGWGWKGQVFQYKWNLGLMANAHHVSPTSAWSSSAGQENYQRCYCELLSALLHDGWKPISRLFLLLLYISFFLILFQIPMTFCCPMRRVSVGSKTHFLKEKMLPYQTQCWIITQNSLIWIFASPKYSDKMIIFGVKIQIPNLNFAPFHFWFLFTKIRPLFNSWLLPKTNQMIFRRN